MIVFIISIVELIRNTAEIGPVTIAKIENKGRQNRRIVVTFA